jgi:hypothetical protein
VLLAVLQEAAEHAAEETSKTPFYIAAGALTAFACLLALVGTLRHETFPPSRGVARGLMALMALLVAATMATAVVTS